MSTQMNDFKPSFTVLTSMAEPPKPKKNKLVTMGLPLIAVLFVFSLVQLHFDYSKIAQGFTKLGGYMGTMFPPDVSAWRHVLLAAIESLQVAIIGSVLGIVVAFFLSFLAASNLTPHPMIAWIILSAASLLRAIPTIVWALIFIVSVGLGPLPGVLAIAVSASGMLVKVFAQSLEEMDKGVLEAMQSTGASWLQIVMQGILPTVKTAFIAWCVLQLEGGIAESTILGAVGAGGIGYEMTHAMKSYNFAAALFVGLVVFVMVFSVEFVANRYKMRLKIRQN
ncbi:MULTISPECIES: phosphonate ABC transporter, permease protein PhnE [Paenibacillus]|uniref:Phosphonate transport system permease protein n=1 Tax=Paenibacillus pabuli TaxID=1472 RepID=A0A855XS66_9BACL|nr:MULTISPECIES: phosphonate ABC transporter, permease protein PhnE [Paenibacillus]PWW34374.1 phosphonate transport system permease protein [Paenibacillus pabuli]PXW00795.1 phosphonate transport system permease protein [Paenibacillus taichungensis]